MVVFVATLMAGSLGGCGALNNFVAFQVGDYVPQWAGGLPADAPPRPGTLKYDEYVREAERRRSQPAPANIDTDVSAASSLAPIH